jgi:drug/metabolite transporter (DMT)-like permease
VTTGAGLALALLSAVALNWGWVAQHGAARDLPTLTWRRPIRALRALFGDLSWVTGFAVGLVGWALYVGALALAPLSLVQAVSAGGIGILAGLAHRRGDRLRRAQWFAVGIAVAGLALLGASLAGGAVSGRTAAPGALAIWLVGSTAVAAIAGASGSRLAPGAGLGIAAGTLYAAGDVATKGAVLGGIWLLLIAVVLAAHGGAFVALQLAFQRGGALATAGTTSLLTNGLPIAAGIALFQERLPGGVLGEVRIAAFACVVLAAGMLARRDPDPQERSRAELVGQDVDTLAASAARVSTSATSRNRAA